MGSSWALFPVCLPLPGHCKDARRQGALPRSSAAVTPAVVRGRRLSRQRPEGAAALWASVPKPWGGTASLSLSLSLFSVSLSLPPSPGIPWVWFSPSSVPASSRRLLSSSLQFFSLHLHRPGLQDRFADVGSHRILSGKRSPFGQEALCWGKKSLAALWPVNNPELETGA